jgi:hypothetical protein
MFNKLIMRKLGITALRLLCVVSFLTVDAQSATIKPIGLMAYQGFLTDAEGQVLGKEFPANYDVVFRIHDDESSEGSTHVLWGEFQTVIVNAGHFSVKLGEGSPYNSEPHEALDTVFKAASSQELYIGLSVKVDDGMREVLPRLQLLSNPFSLLAGHANTAERIVGTDGDVLVTEGNKVGIGVPQPASALDVLGEVQASGGLITQGELIVSKVDASGVVSPVMTTDNGMLAVGKINPSATLDVKGQILFEGDLDISGGTVNINPAQEESLVLHSPTGVANGTTLTFKNSDSQATLQTSENRPLDFNTGAILKNGRPLIAIHEVKQGPIGTGGPALFTLGSFTAIGGLATVDFNGSSFTEGVGRADHVLKCYENGILKGYWAFWQYHNFGSSHQSMQHSKGFSTVAGRVYEFFLEVNGIARIDGNDFFSCIVTEFNTTTH